MGTGEGQPALDLRWCRDAGQHSSAIFSEVLGRNNKNHTKWFSSGMEIQRR